MTKFHIILGSEIALRERQRETERERERERERETVIFFWFDCKFETGEVFDKISHNLGIGNSTQRERERERETERQRETERELQINIVFKTVFTDTKLVVFED